ncbi:MAG: hypothetical protein Kow0031_24000 [Anaerolineae bacterium]
MASDIAIVDCHPKKQTIAPWRRTARLELTVANRGHRPAPLLLSAGDAGQCCLFEFQPPGEATFLAGQTSLTLAAGQVASVPVRVTLPPRRVVALGRARHHLQLRCEPLDWPGRSQIVAVQVAARPLIGPGLLLLVAGLLLAAAVRVAPQVAPFSRQPASAAGLSRAGAETTERPPELSVNPAFGMDPGYQPPARAAAAPKQPGDMGYDEMFETVAAEYNLDPRLLAELAYQESRMNPLALGRDNDMGLMQVIPATWNHWQPRVGATNGPFDPYSNIRVGAAYLAFVRDHVRARGYGYQQPYETLWMLVGYNWGTSNLDKIFNSNGGWAQVPPRQQNYALNIWWAAQSDTPRWQANQP